MATLYISGSGFGVLGAARLSPRVDWGDSLTVGPLRTGEDDERVAVLERSLSPEEVAHHLRERRQRLAAAGDFVVWLERSLAGWLQLLQIHDRIPAEAPVRLRLEPGPPHRLIPSAVRGRLAEARPLSGAERARLRRKWAAVRAADPRGVFEPSFRRQFPWTTDGLTEAERELLQRLAQGARGWAEALDRAARDGVQADGMLWEDAHERLAPLLTPTGRLSGRGRKVLAGDAAFEPREPFPFGGAVATDWRYDPVSGELRPASGA